MKLEKKLTCTCIIFLEGLRKLFGKRTDKVGQGK